MSGWFSAQAVLPNGYLKNRILARPPEAGKPLEEWANPPQTDLR